VRLLLVCLLLIVGQLCLSIFVTPVEFTRRQIAREYQSIQAEFGQSFAVRVKARADALIHDLLATKKSLKHNHSAYQVSGALNQPTSLEMLERAYRYSENLKPVLYQVIQRFSLLSFWAPVVMAMFVIFLLEGLAQRRTKKTDFGYSTVERNRIAIRLLSLLLVLMSLTCFSFIALPALTLLAGCLGLALTLMVVVASSKRSL